MLTAIKEIGEFVRQKNKVSILDTLIQDPKCSHLLTVNFEEDNGNLRFENIDIEQYDSSRVCNKHLYRESKGNKPPLVPTVILNKKEPQKTIKKFYYWVKEPISNKISNTEKSFLKNIQMVLKNKRNHIEKDIITKKNNLGTKDTALLTVKIDDKYLGDYDAFKNLLLIKETERCVIKSPGQVCSICGNKVAEVYGNIIVFKFSAQDKPGFIVGGFNESKSWRNFPVCAECKLSIEQGKKVLQDLKFRVCKGIFYYIIPKFMFGKDFVKRETIDIFMDTPKRISLKDRVRNRIFDDEKDISEILSKENDIIILNYLFLKGSLYGSQDSEKIILLIEDIFPSRLKKIFDAKEKVDKIYDADELFTFANIRYFFEKSDKQKREYDLNRYFLEIVESVFKDKRIDLQFLIKFLIKRIRTDLIAIEYPYNAIENAIKNIIFFETLGLILFKKEVVEMSQFEELFKKYGSAFESPLKRGLFLLGVLTEMLLRKQFSEGKQTKPFLKQIKGLKMDERDIKGLLPKVQNKLQEYNSFDEGKRKITTEVANYLLTAGDDWKLSIDELNFYFSCGMNKVDEIASIVYHKKEDTNGKENQ